MIREDFIAQANRLVYYIAIPAMIFRSISGEPFSIGSHIRVIGFSLAAILIVFGIVWQGARAVHLERTNIATFIQTAFHGNLGYIGLAVSYYFLGDQGLTRASILTGFIMILQNFLAVLILSFYSDGPVHQKDYRHVIRKMIIHPVIMSAIAGLLWASFGFTMPVVVGRTLDILKALSLPMALLLIGASLSLETLRFRAVSLTFSLMIKLIILPGMGLVFFFWQDVSSEEFLPALILLASPTATISYVMAKEMGGDADFAVAAISASTLMSAITFLFWLSLIH